MKTKKPQAAQAAAATAGDSIDALLDLLQAALAAAANDPADVRVQRYNALVAMAAQHVALPHPVLALQLVPVESVQGNDYNPNKVAPPEMRLLQLSIAKDGITKIYDFTDPKQEAARKAPSWRRVCKVMLKNDYWCKGLSFSQTTREMDRQLALITKYMDI